MVLAWPLAGPSIRAVAYSIDMLIRWGVFFAAAIFAEIFSLVLPGFSLGGLLLLLFFLEWGYFIGFEAAWRGQSPGKALLGLRVMMENGQPVTWWASTLRNLLRAADTLPLMLIFSESLSVFAMIPVYGPGFLAMAFTSRCQRLGDLAARTVVVEERRQTMPRQPVILERIEPLPRESLSSFVPSPRTLAIIDEFLSRRSALKHERGHLIAASLAGPLAQRLGVPADDHVLSNYPMAWLGRVYVTFNPKAVPSSRVLNTTADPEPYARKGGVR